MPLGFYLALALFSIRGLPFCLTGGQAFHYGDAHKDVKAIFLAPVDLQGCADGRDPHSFRA